MDSVVTSAKASERSRPHARQSRHRPPTGVPAGCGHMVIGLGVKRGVGVRVGVRVRVDARVGVRVGVSGLGLSATASATARVRIIGSRVSPNSGPSPNVRAPALIPAANVRAPCIDPCGLGLGLGLGVGLGLGSRVRNPHPSPNPSPNVRTPCVDSRRPLRRVVAVTALWHLRRLDGITAWLGSGSGSGLGLGLGSGYSLTPHLL